MLLDTQPILDALPEPSLIVRIDGEVVFANKAARAIVGKLESASLPALTGNDPGELRTYLRRCSGSGQPVIGRISIAAGAGGQPMALRCYGSRLRSGSGNTLPLVLLRFSPASDDRFTGLKRQIEALHHEIRHRRRIQALLEEALSERDLLLRELRHRIGNNFQMLLGMLSSAGAAAKQPETRSILDRACRRIVAINAAQGLLYGTGLRSVSTTEFIEHVCAMLLEATGSRHELCLEVEQAKLSNDLVTPVALVISELLTNAVKHAFPDREFGRIVVRLRTVDDELELTVTDDGVGFDDTKAGNGGSGFEIVRGLVRQLGGSFEVHCRGGTHCVVRFTDGRGALQHSGTSAGAAAS